MKHFEVNIKKPENAKTDFTDPEVTCSKNECSGMAIGCIQGTTFQVNFCLSHEEEGLKNYTEVCRIMNDSELIFSGPLTTVPHIKLKYFTPQLVPEDIQQLLKDTGITLNIYCIDEKSLDAVRAVLKNQLIQKNKTGKYEISMSDHEEN